MPLAPVSAMPVSWGGMEVGSTDIEAVGEVIGGLQEESNCKERK